MKSEHVHLLFLSFVFMATFQLLMRLVSYVYLFHQGILLASSVLVGGAFGLLLYRSVSERYITLFTQWLPACLAASFFITAFLFFKQQAFLLTFVSFSFLFALLFVAIARLLTIRPHMFYALDLFGSFLGAGAIVIVSIFFLEEWVLVGVSVLYVIYALVTIPRNTWGYTVGVIALASLLYTLPQVISKDLVTLITCAETTYSYKAVCLDDGVTASGVVERHSLPDVKGRSEVYITDGEFPRKMTVRNSGLYAGTTIHEEDFKTFEYSFFDTEVPALAYSPGSTVVNLGASTGANVQSFNAYITKPRIVGIDIDRTVQRLVSSGLYEPFLPDENYTFAFGEARAFLEAATTSFDVIAAQVESVNSSLDIYVDESTSLVYTKEAFQTYLSKLNSEGYLLLQQYAPVGEPGDAMTLKLLGTLEAAGAEDLFENRVLMYRAGFSRDPEAQSFVIVVYRPQGFTREDATVFLSWYESMTTFVLDDTLNPHALTLVHTPEIFADVGLHETYRAYSDAIYRNELDAHYNTSIVTDNKPFRHLITNLPFPYVFYVWFLLLASILCVLLIYTNKRTSVDLKPTVLSLLLGVATFGLQYLLYYKTAVVMNTNLIFFSVFLLVPLLFGALGGLLTPYVTGVRWSCALTAFGVLALLAVYDVVDTRFEAFSLAAMIFVLSGLFFPTLLRMVNDIRSRMVLYAANLAGGGFALILYITLHATIGWTYTWLMTSVGLIAAGLILYYYRHSR